MASSYLYLVEKMHAALNSESGDDEVENGMIDGADSLCCRAEESYEFGDISRANKNYISVRKILPNISNAHF